MWRLTAGQQLRCHSWGDESILYNDLSGDTHLLDDSAIFLLRLLQRAAQPEAMLVAAMCTEFEADHDDASARDIVELLASLHALSLIEWTAC
jgi:PqqD family protein of HPr-rel-A system